MDLPRRVAIQIVLRLGEQPCGSRHSARLGRWACRETGHDTARQARDTARHACDMAGAGPTTRHIERHDTTQHARCLGAVRAAWAYHARSQGRLGVHLVHLTQFWTQCIVSVTVWTDVHEHCSKDFFFLKIKNKIK